MFSPKDDKKTDLVDNFEKQKSIEKDSKDDKKFQKERKKMAKQQSKSLKKSKKIISNPDEDESKARAIKYSKLTPKIDVTREFIKNNTIVFNNFVKKFKNQSIGPVTFGVEGRGVTALLGASGAGKSVVMNALMGATRKYDGKIYILGKVRKSWNGHLSNKLIGYYTQMDFSLFEQSAYSYLYSMCLIMGLKLREISTSIEYWMRFFQLWEYRNKKLKDYSWGMKNRINLLLCFIKEPEIIVMDEPGANLDSIWRLKVKKLIQEKHDQGKTIFITVHNIDEIVDIIDNYIIINEGKLVFNGTKTELDIYNKYEIKLAKDFDEKELVEFLEEYEVVTMEVNKEDKQLVIAVKESKKINALFIYLMKNNIPLLSVTKLQVNMESINKALKSYYNQKEAELKGMKAPEDPFKILKDKKRAKRLAKQKAEQSNYDGTAKQSYETPEQNYQQSVQNEIKFDQYGNPINKFDQYGNPIEPMYDQYGNEIWPIDAYGNPLPLFDAYGNPIKNN